jgi:ubiquinone/menaquinone biosynthesis C-methylase UbiE/uncharacterized protein YbaR (Trm112 family)
MHELTSVLDRLESNRSLLRSGAYYELLEHLWAPDAEAPGIGRLGPHAAEAVPALVAWLARDNAPDRGRAAFLLALLAEATDEGGERPLHAAISESLPAFLDAFDGSGADDADSNLQSSDPALYESLLFLVSHFGEDADSIIPRLAEVLGAENRGMHAVKRVFDTEASRPEHSRAISTFLGGRASYEAGEDRLALCRSTLACPSCHGALDFEEDEIECAGCATKYAWHDDIPDLVPSGQSTPSEFPAELVDMYEKGTRPRFVSLMSGDWTSVVDRSIEADYIRRHLTPVPGPVLDLACGAGGITQLVADAVGAARILALDYSVPMLGACAGAIPHVIPVRGDSSSLPIADGSLGGANCSDALQALPDPEAAIREVARCLRPGAPFTCFTFREGPGPYAYFQSRLSAHRRHLFTDAAIHEAAERAGLEVTDMSGPSQAVFFTARKLPS